MRDQVVNYLDSQSLGSFGLSQELPFDANDTPLYLKNVKRIYVNKEQTSTEQFIGTMSGPIDQEIVSVLIYVVTDAKNLPADYQTVLLTIKSAQSLYNINDNGFYKRDVSSETEYKSDLMITTVELRFYKILT